MADGVQRRRIEKRFALMGGILLIGVVVICFVIASGAALLANDPDCYFAGNRGGAYFRLPPSTQNIERYSDSRSRSCAFAVRFQIPANELDTFLATALIKSPLVSRKLTEQKDNIDYYQETIGWQLDTTTVYRVGKKEMGDGRERHLDVQRLFVDTSNPDEYMVYLATTINWL
jgi:hypothetical protein